MFFTFLSPGVLQQCSGESRYYSGHWGCPCCFYRGPMSYSQVQCSLNNENCISLPLLPLLSLVIFLWLIFVSFIAEVAMISKCTTHFYNFMVRPLTTRFPTLQCYDCFCCPTRMEDRCSLW